jgi:hypothetical protein
MPQRQEVSNFEARLKSASVYVQNEGSTPLLDGHRFLVQPLDVSGGT